MGERKEGHEGEEEDLMVSLRRKEKTLHFFSH